MLVNANMNYGNYKISEKEKQNDSETSYVSQNFYLFFLFLVESKCTLYHHHHPLLFLFTSIVFKSVFVFVFYVCLFTVFYYLSHPLLSLVFFFVAILHLSLLCQSRRQRYFNKTVRHFRNKIKIPDIRCAKNKNCKLIFAFKNRSS